MARSDTPRPLAGRWLDMLRDGDVRGDYGSTYAAAMAVAVACVRAGWSRIDYVAAMTDWENQLAAAHYRDREKSGRRGQASVYRKIERDWDKATRYATDNPQATDRTVAMQQIGLIRAALAGYPWIGRADAIARNRQVLGILLDLGERGQTTSPAISIRSLCERSSYRSIQTISNAVEALTRAGWVQVDTTDHAADLPTIYRLRHPNGGGAEVGQLSVLPPGGTAVHVLHPPKSHPRDRMNTQLALVLGTTPAVIYATLDPDIPQAKNNVVRRSGAAKRSVDRWLPELAKLGLARWSPAGWLQAATDPELVAVENGSIDLIDFRKLRHDVQRRGYRQHKNGRTTARNTTTKGQTR